MILKCNCDETPVLELWGSVEYSFIAINPRSALTRIGCTFLDSIYGLNRAVWKIIRIRKEPKIKSPKK